MIRACFVINQCEEQMCGFSMLLKGDNVLFSSRKVERHIRTRWDEKVSSFFPLPTETYSIWLIKRQTQRNAWWHPDGRQKQGLEVKQNRTWLKIKTLAKRGWGMRDMSVEVYCRSQKAGLQRDLNGGLEWWINGYSGPVTPSVGTGPPVNKWRHTDMASYTPLCFNPLLESCSLLLRIQFKEDESRKGKCLLVRLVWFGDPIWQHVFCKHCNCSLFSESAQVSGIRLFCVVGKETRSW